MAINYRNVDPHKVASDVMKDRAKEWEERAYAAEMEVRRLEAIQEIDPADGEVAETLMKARAEARSGRGKARRAAGAAPLEPEEAIAVREAFLNNWLTAIETQHAQQSAFLDDARRQLELTGDNAIKGEDRTELEDAIGELEKSVRVLEATHGLATGALDAVQEHPDASTNGEGSVDDMTALSVLGN